jgi:hypothetical protein
MQDGSVQVGMWRHLVSDTVQRLRSLFIRYQKYGLDTRDDPRSDGYWATAKMANTIIARDFT